MLEASVRLFISYSHRDEALRQQLDKHLAPLKRKKVIKSWHDRTIQAGMDWANEIDGNLNKSDIILLLISPDFVASEYCYNIELDQAIKRHEAGEAIVVPVILEPCDWSGLPFANFQTFPKDAKAITTWENANEALLDVVTGIRKVAEELFAKRKLVAEQKQANRARYLQKIEEALSDGVISIVERDTLDELQAELGLTEEEAKEIEAQVYQPYSRYQENLNKYKQTIHKLIQKKYYPFAEEIKKDLENRQRDLGLKHEDVEQIIRPILEEAETKYQERLQTEAAERQQEPELEAENQSQLARQQQKQEEYESKLRRYEEEFSKAVQTEYPLTEYSVQRTQNFWQSLELNAEDVERIEQPILAEAEAKYQESLQAELQQPLEEATKEPEHLKKFQEVSSLEGHPDDVKSVAFSPDGKTIASSSDYTTGYIIKLWDLQSKQEIRTLSCNSDFVSSVAFSPDGETLASSGIDKMIKLWNWKTGEKVCTLSGHSDWVHSVAFSPDGETLVSSSDKKIQLWNWKTGQEICTLSGHSSSVLSVVISSDGEKLASLDFMGNVKLWNLRDREVILNLKSSHAVSMDGNEKIAISPDGQTLVVGLQNGNVDVWDLPTGKLRQTISAHEVSFFGADGVTSLAISPDGQMLASACGDGKDKTIKLWNLATGKLCQTLHGHDRALLSVTFSPDGQTLVSGSYDKTVRIWS